MTDKSDSAPDAPTNASPVTEEQVANTPPVDLVAEAGEAAASTDAAPVRNVRSLDDLNLDDGARAQIESYVSKSVNDAIQTHDERQQRKLDDEGFMNKAQIEELLTEKDAEYTRRETAKDNFLNILGTEGIAPGSDEYQKIQSYYRGAVDEGKLTPHILLSEAGIKTLVAMSGVGSAQSASPQSGLSRSAPAPDGSATWSDGTVQLNADAGVSTNIDSKMRDDIQRALGNL
jgi:hypothetical protein